MANMEPWIDCIFQHFDGITDASWRSICGTHPKDRLPVVLATIAIGSWLCAWYRISDILHLFDTTKCKKDMVSLARLGEEDKCN